MSGLPGRGKPQPMASAKVGVVTAIDVNGPMSNPPPGKLLDKNSAGTWAMAWFVVAIVMLFIIL